MILLIHNTISPNSHSLSLPCPVHPERGRMMEYETHLICQPWWICCLFCLCEFPLTFSELLIIFFSETDNWNWAWSSFPWLTHYHIVTFCRLHKLRLFGVPAPIVSMGVTRGLNHLENYYFILLSLSTQSSFTHHKASWGRGEDSHSLDIFICRWL